MKTLILLLAAVPAIFLAGCKKDSAGQQAANIKFKLTDAPADFAALYIDVKGIQVLTEADGWVTFNSSIGVINILDYVNGNATVVADAQIPAGRIEQVRLMLGDNNTIVVAGATMPINLNANMQSGLTLNVNTNVDAGGNYEWTIDFDVAKSVVLAGANYSLQPALRLIVDAGVSANTNTSVVVERQITGNISGNVSGLSGLAVVTATNNVTGQSASTVTTLTGDFRLQAMYTGIYTVTIDPMLPLLSTRTVSNVNVAAGQTTSLGLVAL